MKQAMMKKMDRFKDLTDEEIVRMAQEEHDAEATDYIVHKYRNFVKAKARSYFLIGADKEDIIQEGMIFHQYAIHCNQYCNVVSGMRILCSGRHDWPV